MDINTMINQGVLHDHPLFSTLRSVIYFEGFKNKHQQQSKNYVQHCFFSNFIKDNPTIPIQKDYVTLPRQPQIPDKTDLSKNIISTHRPFYSSAKKFQHLSDIHHTQHIKAQILEVFNILHSIIDQFKTSAIHHWKHSSFTYQK